MAILKKEKITSSHWYDANGNPRHRVPRASGDGDRPTTLKDARKYGWFPSVTSILGILAKPGLDTWKQKQVALAALRLERDKDESDEYFVDRIIGEAFEQVHDAADLGTRIHDAIDKHFEGVPVDDDLRPYTDPVFKWKDEKNLEFLEREKTVVNPQHGFAGTLDAACTFGKTGKCLIDFKTRKTTPGRKATPYDGQAAQVAAYAATYWGEDLLTEVWGCNVFISTTEPGRMETCFYSPEELSAEWNFFKHACVIWRHLKKFNPVTQWAKIQLEGDKNAA